MTSAVNRARVLASQLNEFPAKSNYVAGDAWRNWSATHGECRPAHHHYPTSMDDVGAGGRQSAATLGDM